MQDFITQSSEIINTFNDFIKINELENIVTPDHICFKCSTGESYENIRSLFEFESQYIQQSIISNRRISIIKFKEPIKTVVGDIWFLELSDKKPSVENIEKFDHIEMVAKNGNFQEMFNYCVGKGLHIEKVERPHHTTYNIKVDNYTFCLSEEFLVEKIKREEM